MKFSSIFTAPSAIAILSTALLFGPSGASVAQAATGSAASLPSITVEAPKPVARPHRSRQAAGQGVSRRGSRTAQRPSAAPGSILGRIAKLERSSSSCNGGCETSFRKGNAPWVGCSTSEGENSVSSFSPTCTDTLTYKTYVECTDTKIFLGWIAREARWHCSSLLAGGKLAGEELARDKRMVAELKRAMHR